MIRGRVVLGENVRIGDWCIIGSRGEHKVFDSDLSKPLCIGSGTTITDRVVVQRGVEPDNSVREDELSLFRNTSIGPGCYIMDGVHVAHDCVIQEHVTIAPSVVLGGHTQLMPRCYMGISSATHQHVVVGPLAMVGMGAMVTRNVMPFAVMTGVPASYKKPNEIGIQRAGLSAEEKEQLLADYRAVCENIPNHLIREKTLHVD